MRYSYFRMNLNQSFLKDYRTKKEEDYGGISRNITEGKRADGGKPAYWKGKAIIMHSVCLLLISDRDSVACLLPLRVRQESRYRVEVRAECPESVTTQS